MAKEDEEDGGGPRDWRSQLCWSVSLLFAACLSLPSPTTNRAELCFLFSLFGDPSSSFPPRVGPDSLAPNFSSSSFFFSSSVSSLFPSCRGKHRLVPPTTRVASRRSLEKTVVDLSTLVLVFPLPVHMRARPLSSKTHAQVSFSSTPTILITVGRIILEGTSSSGPSVRAAIKQPQEFRMGFLRNSFFRTDIFCCCCCCPSVFYIQRAVTVGYCYHVIYTSRLRIYTTSGADTSHPERERGNFVRWKETGRKQNRKEEEEDQ